MRPDAPPPPDDAPAAELRGVSFAYRRRPVLEDVDLRVEAGDFLGIIGPNGAGKTTLLRLMLGLLEPGAGTVRVFGLSPRRARGRVGYVPQHARFRYDFPIRVRDVVLMGRLGSSEAFARFGREDRRAAGGALDRLDIAEIADRQIGELSGGQLQRVLIARALVMKPRLLLLDEPTASVDASAGGGIYRLLRELASAMTIILVSHDVGVISREVERVACLNCRLFDHGSEELTPEMLREAYGAPVEMVAHGRARMLGEHEDR